MSVSETINYLNKLTLDKIDYLLLYVRLLFPSYYFDLYEEVINDNKDEEELNKIIELSTLYEELLYNVYLTIQSKTNIIGINWINNNFM